MRKTKKNLKPTLANVRRVLARFGGRLDRDDYPSSYRLFAYAPDGYCWSDGIHGLVGDVFPGFKGSAAEAYEDLIDRMRDGIVVCACSECIGKPSAKVALVPRLLPAKEQS